ncbi:MAG TPA: hypothetical protein VM166_03315 [Gemmatimonadaceae bacterium]|nr:hypothetical protein [Gemmatimonadaceae bacterium]
MKRTLLFVTTMLGGGFFAALGSIVGHAAGKTGLFVGGVIGGLFGVTIATRLAVWRRWIEPRDYYPTTFGGEIGFIVAALIAVKTLSSPVGPVLSTLLVGIGALAGLHISARRIGKPG